NYVIIDAPGHKEFLKNMVTGAASADAALLLIDAYEGVQEQSRRHGYILRLLGLSQVVVVINKMDLVDYDPETYFRIKAEFSDFLESLGVKAREYVPVSAKQGVNIARLADEMPWYKGPTVLEILDQFEEKLRFDHLSFRMPVQDVYKFDARRIIAGRVEAGKVKVGDRVVFSPSNKKAVVQSIEGWNVSQAPEEVVCPLSTGFTLNEQLFIERGEIVSLESDLPLVSTMFDANLFWMGQRHLEKGRTYTLKLTTQEVPCEVAAFNKVIDASTLETLPDQDFLAKNDVAELTLKTSRPVVFDLYGSVPNTGRFVIVDDYDVCGGGIIITYTPTKLEDKIRDEVRHRDFNWIKSNIKPEERAYRNGHRAALILISGAPGVGKANLARHLEEKLFHLNFQSYLLDRRNVQLGVLADVESGEDSPSSSELVRRFGEVARLFLDAGHVVISTSNAFNQEDDTGLRMLVEPFPVVDVLVSDEPDSQDPPPDLMFSRRETQNEAEAANRIYQYLRDKKILTGFNYSI
nr:adenylyl-sulfate kinase [Nitrospinaceae bacterium]NIR55225.1 adenylyl-sulfate kinase [Nitrospinaceae bacterium]NIS85652.1 adenylyl-sulfate kinase [Nitrospinaceae bacterium]NIT82497.1 adenylyl-sulfate kinase [Nitrospinaceae bacterium]NIU44702.1 adenylyl-sulfate kinase [Nitrospinaceae bacterium]